MVEIKGLRERVMVKEAGSDVARRGEKVAQVETLNPNPKPQTLN